MTEVEKPPAGNAHVVGTFPFPGDHEPIYIQLVVFDGEPGKYWFFAMEVCRAIGVPESRNSTRYAPPESRRLIDRNSVSNLSAPTSTRGNPNVLLISEAGMYRILMHTRKPLAEMFQAWVCEEVLPAIRQTGSYSPVQSPALSHSEALRGYAEALRAHADEVERCERLEQEKRALVGEVEANHELRTAVSCMMGTETTFSVAEAAQALCRDPRIDTGERRLFNLMARNKWIHRVGGDDGKGRWKPYQRLINAKKLETAISEYREPDGTLHVTTQVRVTIKGQLSLWSLLGGVGTIPPAVLELPQ